MTLKVQDDFKKIIPEIRKLEKFNLAKKCLQHGAELLQRELRKDAPHRTGKYVNSWKTRKPKKDSITIETPMGQLMLWLEFTGTRPHVIVPRRAKVLKWVNRETGQDVYAMKVNHPGTKPQPHLRPFIKKILPKWIDYTFTQIKKEHVWLGA